MMGKTTGRVISLDRVYPLLKTAEGETRAQHSIDFVKNTDIRAVVGDIVEIVCPFGQDIPLIIAIQPRGHTLVRRSLVESKHEGAGKHNEQILATNIDIVLVMTALSNRSIDLPYLERQLVMAHESGADVAIVLSKADQAKHLSDDVAAVREIAFDSPIIVESAVTGEGLQQVAELISNGRTGVLLGRSGVGKSTLINKLLGAPVLETASVRGKDRAGRHTTVARRMVFFEDLSALGSVIIDTPGLRSIGLYAAYTGLAAAFPDIVGHAASCRYRNCSHTGEPGCAAQEAVAQGILPQRRLASYVDIAAEVTA